MMWTTSADQLDDIWGSLGRHLGVLWTTSGGSTGRHLGVNRATSGGSCGRHLAVNWTTSGGHSSCTINVGIVACKHGHMDAECGPQMQNYMGPYRRECGPQMQIKTWSNSRWPATIWMGMAWGYINKAIYYIVCCFVLFRCFLFFSSRHGT